MVYKLYPRREVDARLRAASLCNSSRRSVCVIEGVGIIQKKKKLFFMGRCGRVIRCGVGGVVFSEVGDKCF